MIAGRVSFTDYHLDTIYYGYDYKKTRRARKQ